MTNQKEADERGVPVRWKGREAPNLATMDGGNEDA